MREKAFTVALILTGFLAMGFLAGTTWTGYQINAGATTDRAGQRPSTRFPSSLSELHIRKAVEGIQLSETQRQEIDTVARDLETRMAGLRAPFFSEVERTLKDAHTRILAQLDVDQKAQARQNIDAWNKRLQQPGSHRRSSGKSGSSGRGGGGGFRDWEKTADANNDGELTDDEKNSYWDNYWKERGGGPMPSSYDWGWIVRNFERIDTDSDGKLSAEECAKARETSRRSAGSSGRFGGPGGGRTGPGGGRSGGPGGSRGGFGPDGRSMKKGGPDGSEAEKSEGGLKDFGNPVKEDQ